MPFYDFACPSCGAVHEAKKSIAERATDPCVCGCVAVQKICAPGFSLKGTGWARDGYGSPVSGADYRAGRVSKRALDDIPVAGPDGKFYSKEGKHIAG